VNSSLVSLISLLIIQGAHPLHTIPSVPGELLDRPTTIRSGIGAAHDAVTTSSREAQAFYDQGLAYLHSYDWIEAARSLHQALRLDPSIALAYVGLSTAYWELNKPAEARAAIERAKTLGAKLSPHERHHIDAAAARLDAEDHPGDPAKLAAYRRALDAALAAFPSDVELILQRGIAESPDPSDRGQGAVRTSIDYFKRALAASPGHFAAHHYLTHACENTGQIDEALTHGEVFAKSAPAIPHARHMYGHDLRRLGRVKEAIAEFEAADRLHREYFTREHVAPEMEWQFQHNLDLLASSYRYLGQLARAEPLLKESFALPSNLVTQVYNKREWPGFLRARGRLEEALAAARAMIGHPHRLIQSAGHIEAGYVLAVVGKWGEAAEESNHALRILRTQPEGAAMAAPALLGLQGEFALRTADREKGRRLVMETAGRLRALPGPDAWVQALFALEDMARTARQVGDWDLAAQLAGEMLAHDPAYGGTHHALALVAEHAGDKEKAAAEFTAARKAWSEADRDVLKDLKP
jgi:tetratricopeptide (TPR) repeat protein